MHKGVVHIGVLVLILIAPAGGVGLYVTKKAQAPGSSVVLRNRVEPGNVVQDVSDTNIYTVAGELGCLPHRSNTLPAKEECVLGILTETDGNYKLIGIGVPYPRGTRIMAQGTIAREVDAAYLSFGTLRAVSVNIISGEVPQDTSGWQTYRNEEYGFEFKYPPELTEFPSHPGTSEFYIGFSNVSTGGSYQIYPGVSSNINPALYTRKIITGGREVFIYESQTEIPGRSIIDIFSPHGKQFQFILIRMVGLTGDVELKKTIEGVLSTFKFISQQIVKPIVPTDEMSCKSAGGRWIVSAHAPPGAIVPWVCALPTVGSGKTCQDSFECESGLCNVDTSVRAGTKTSGTCYGWTVWPSCLNTVRQGIALGGVCE